MKALREDGLWLGLAGNQTVSAGRILRELEFPVDMVATSDDWGVSKPDPAFFEHVIEAVPYPAEEILYVGDRLDNDIRPAAESGMVTALIRRGPWGVIQEHDPAADEIAALRISSLAELPTWISTLNESGREGR